MQVEHLSIKMPTKVRIEFKTQTRNTACIVSDTLLVDPSDPEEVQRVAAKCLRKSFCLFDTAYKSLIPRSYFDQVTRDGTNTILVIPVSEVNTTCDIQSNIDEGLEYRDKKIR